MNLSNWCLMVNIDWMRRNILACDTCITHDGDTWSNFFIYACSFIAHWESMVSAKLMTYFMNHIINIKIITLRNSISRRSNATAFRTIGTNTTNTTRVSTTTSWTKHMSNIIIGFANYWSKCRLKLCIPAR